jgi:hypothetical protein
MKEYLRVGLINERMLEGPKETEMDRWMDRWKDCCRK